ncbi:MAG: gamma-glutamyl-gamma-aminobutyrate hydrolase family protein [Clostridium sp.]|uniref:gamma-glutamyl-gamma-aminobutyrate hydrolase family protein n=1 Tax=Clostridium sp. TaxID=1506 RepID=UPI0030595B15
MKPTIGIFTSIFTISSGDFAGVDRVYVNFDYVNAVKEAGGTPLLIPPTVDDEDIDRFSEVCDGFILSGGVDINPIFYNEEPHIKLGVVNNELDNYQIKLTKKLIDMDKPILGICRGLQLLNVVLGGTLYQDLPSQDKDAIKHAQDGKRYDYCHSVKIDKNSKLYKLIGENVLVNSYHHQSIKTIGKGLRVVANSADNGVEAVEMEGKRFVVGTQWHPEMMLVGSKEMLPIFKALVEVSK